MTNTIFEIDWETGEIPLRYGDLFAGGGVAASDFANTSL